jgi:tRNA (guanine-N7-)-methyltransferase
LGDPVVTNEIETVLDFLAGRKRVEIEIGSGNGHFLSAYGERVRNAALVGIEAKSKRCGKIEKKITASGLSHVIVFRGKAETLVHRLGPESVDAIHIYFPDPWPKTKHRRRRFMRWPSLLELDRVLKPGGCVYFGSDVFDYYLQAKLLFLHHGAFTIRDETVPPEAVASIYSKKTKAAGKQCHSVVACKTPLNTP